MNEWKFSVNGYDPACTALDGNRFLCANGYMGLRGTVEEADKGQFPAVTLAGVYDRFEDKWREPVNAPHGLSIRLSLDGQPLDAGRAAPLKHTMEIDYRTGTVSRETDFGAALVRSRRFASMAFCHLLADRYEVLFSADGEMALSVGISTDVWDINGPHLFDYSFERGDTLSVSAVTGEKRIPVAVAQRAVTDFEGEESFVQDEGGVFRVIRRAVRAGERLTVCVFAGVYTGLDGGRPLDNARQLCQSAAQIGYEACLSAHRAAWEAIWQRSEVSVSGNEEAARALHASQYHLNSIAPRHADNMSIPARGLSGQTYKGAVFWDTEMFFFPMFVYTQPEVARSLLRYRIDTLPGALEKAAEYGYRGAFYAWESQEGGREGCTNFNVVDVFTHRPVRTYFRDKQIHISGDIAYALYAYWEITGDRSLLEEGGARVILECARFYLSRASCLLDREEIDFADVIGPDEYHERVTNNAYTNGIILNCMENALALEDIFKDRPEWFTRLIKETHFEKDWLLLSEAKNKIRRPRKRNGVTEQFDGYFDLEDCSLDTVRGRLRDPREYWGGDHGVAGCTQVIKQADVIALAALFPECFTDGEVAANWDYYEPRTEHGSSLSACMYALTACRTGKLDQAWELFMRTASIDILGGGKEWAGEIYIGGTHPASNGGAWMIAALGFAGLSMKNGEITLDPHLPKQLSRLSFPLTARGTRWIVTVTHEGASVRQADERCRAGSAIREE